MIAFSQPINLIRIRKTTQLKINLTIILALSLFASNGVHAVENIATLDNANNEALAYNCAGCHGSNGISAGPSIPTIAGLSPTYLVKIMEDFKSDKVPSTIMGRISKGYTSKEIEQLGHYYYQQVFVSADQSVNSKKAKLGEELHKQYCERCHSEAGGIQEDDAGLLKGQWKPYLKDQLQDFLNKDRKAPKKMARRLKKLYKKYGYEGIQALLEFYSSP